MPNATLRLIGIERFRVQYGQLVTADQVLPIGLDVISHTRSALPNDLHLDPSRRTAAVMPKQQLFV